MHARSCSARAAQRAGKFAGAALARYAQFPMPATLPAASTPTPRTEAPPCCRTATRAAGRALSLALARLGQFWRRRAADRIPTASGDIREIVGQPVFIPLFKLFLGYGKIFRLSFGPKSFIVISDNELAKQVGLGGGEGRVACCHGTARGRSPRPPSSAPLTTRQPSKWGWGL